METIVEIEENFSSSSSSIETNEYRSRRYNTRHKLSLTSSKTSSSTGSSYDWDADDRDIDSVTSLSETNIFTVSRLNTLMEDSWDYGGILYSNSFKVDRPISLIGVGFYGPHNQMRAIYIVEVVLELLSPRGRSKELACIRISVSVPEKKDKFYVEFLTPVKLRANEWYTLKFQLDGPNTGRGEELNTKRQVCADGRVNFEFFKGSRQMPDICFTF